MRHGYAKKHAEACFFTWSECRDLNYSYFLYRFRFTLFFARMDTNFDIACMDELRIRKRKREKTREKKAAFYLFTALINCSILVALSLFICSVTWPYTSNVKAAVAWPKFSCTVFISSPERIEATA